MANAAFGKVALATFDGSFESICEFQIVFQLFLKPDLDFTHLIVRQSFNG